MPTGTEPTWIFLDEMPELKGDGDRLERILVDFEARGLATRTREPSGKPGTDWSDPDDWWALTPPGRSHIRE